MSSVAQKQGLKKTKSARKRLVPKRLAIGAVVALVGLVVMLLPTLFYQPPRATLQAAGRTVKLDIASTEATREKGLGDRESMADDHGMLFVLDKPDKACFWMKDMQFSLDIIWLNTAKQVVHIERNLSPETYPASYCPKLPAKYVVELNAGQSEKLHISTGDTLKL